MHQHGKEAAGELGPVQAWKFAAFCKALFVNTTAVAGKEVTGDGIYNHVTTVGTCFDILFLHISFGPVQVCCQRGDFGGRDIDHEGAATVATACAIYLGGNGGVKLLDKQVNPARFL